jgi:hypothetical protein
MRASILFEKYSNEIKSMARRYEQKGIHCNMIRDIGNKNTHDNFGMEARYANDNRAHAPG